MNVETAQDPAERELPAPSSDTTPYVTWSHVDDGFYVGSAHGEFVGYVDRQADGDFLASNLYARSLGAFAELAAAMTAVSTAHAEATRTSTAHVGAQTRPAGILRTMESAT